MTLLSPEVTLAARYNVAPTQSAPVIVPDPAGAGAVLRMMQWGLIPAWAKDSAIGASLVNARAETVDTKASFREAFKRRRCLVPMSGFYEWRAVEGRKLKQPMYISPVDGLPWLVAGLFESWASPQGLSVETFTIVTTGANDAIRGFHDRMPVILEPDRARLWLGRGSNGTALEGRQWHDLRLPYPSERMRVQAVSRLVNSPKVDSEACIQVVDFQEDKGLFDIAD